MNLKRYYAELRDIEAEMDGPHVFVMSLATEDGGRAGVVTEVPTFEAAVMIKQNRGRLLDLVERDAHVATLEKRRRRDEERRLAERVHVTVVAQDPLRGHREDKE